MTRLIERNTTIPARRCEVFTTAADDQPSVEVHVVQGEREMADGNTTLGRFVLDGIPPAAMGEPQIEVTFDIDADGIVNVSAKDRATGREQSITITGQSSLAPEQVERMLRDAEQHAALDRERRALADARNDADALARRLGDAAAATRGAAPADLKAAEAALDELRSAGASSDPGRISAACEVARAALAALSRTGAANSGGADAEVVDAEVVDAEVVE